LSGATAQARGVRVLTSAVLAMEAIVVLLAIPVAVVAGGYPGQVGWFLGAIGAVCALLPGAHGRSWYRSAGWAVQVAVVASGVWVPMMYGLGLMFAGLWWLAIRIGSKPGQRRAPV
jgi:hypothetical protein